MEDRSIMQFYLGEIYQADYPMGPRQAIVVEVKERGYRGKLRFLDTEEEHVVVWTEMRYPRTWRRVNSG